MAAGGMQGYVFHCWPNTHFDRLLVWHKPGINSTNEVYYFCQISCWNDKHSSTCCAALCFRKYKLPPKVISPFSIHKNAPCSAGIISFSLQIICIIYSHLHIWSFSWAPKKIPRPEIFEHIVLTCKDVINSQQKHTHRNMKSILKIHRNIDQDEILILLSE